MNWFDVWLAGALHLVGVTAVFMLVAGVFVAQAWFLCYVVLPRAMRALARLEARLSSNESDPSAPLARWDGVHHEEADKSER